MLGSDATLDTEGLANGFATAIGLQAMGQQWHPLFVCFLNWLVKLR
jgi:hypothetical protein